MRVSGRDATARPDVRGGRSAESSPRPARGMLWIGLLYLMLWGGYNTDYGRLSEPGFPRNALDLFHGLRALFPIVAGWLAILTLLARGGGLRRRTFEGSLGLLALYALIGILSSLFISREPLMGLYWGVQYASVILVLWVSLSEEDSLSRIVRLIKLNWIIAALLATVLLGLIWLDPDVTLKVSGTMVVRSHGGGGRGSEEIFGMASTRSTGVARYAAIAGLAAFTRLMEGSAVSRIAWLLVFILSVFGLVTLQARTALIAFLAGSFLILWLHRSSRALSFVWVPLAGLLLAVTGSYGAFWSYVTRGKVFDPTLTGRTGTWALGWPLLKESPWLGWGFQADRIYLAGQHMHNALLQALVQTGLLGTIAFVAGIVTAWIVLVRLYLAPRLPGIAPLPIEIPAVLAFVTIASITESTVAFFGSVWLLVAPLLAYTQALNWQRRMVTEANGRTLLTRVRSAQSSQ